MWTSTRGRGWGRNMDVTEIFYRIWSFVNSIYNSFLGNLLSGVLGALLLYLFQKKGERKKEEQEVKNLAVVLYSDLLRIVKLLESESKELVEVVKIDYSNNLWYKLTPEITRLLPPALTQKVAYTYAAIEMLVHKNFEEIRDPLYYKIFSKTLSDKGASQVIRDTVNDLYVFSECKNKHEREKLKIKI
jgi:hypothetical protein